MLLLFGCLFGLIYWIESSSSGIPATSGTLMVAGLTIIVGLQLLFLSYDVDNTPNEPLHTKFHIK